MITLAEVLATGLPLDDHGKLAEALSIGRVKLVKTEIGNLTIVGTIGMAAGNALLDTINTVEDFRHVRYPLSNGWLDVANPTVRAMLDTLCSTAHASALKKLAEVVDVVTSQEVSAVLEGYVNG